MQKRNAWRRRFAIKNGDGINGGGMGGILSAHVAPNERREMRIDEDRLKLTQVLHCLLIDYWHDVDRNWGRNAPDYYTQDGRFVGPAAAYEGREKIRAFYNWREKRGDRTVVHSVQNFQAFFDGAPDKAICHWFMMLYAADGKPVLPTHPPIQIAYMTDHLINTDEGWKVTYRRFDILFEGGTPATNPVLDEK